MMDNNHNQLAQTPQNKAFSTYVNKPNIQQAIINSIGEKKLPSFIASIVTVVSNNPQLQECDQNSVLCGALAGESLNLSLFPQLGQCYLVPYRDKKRGMVATFQIGYKGFIQLAINSGFYRKINAISIKQGEILGFDPLDETYNFNFILDHLQRAKAPTIGYCAFFEMVNGYKKTIYWSKQEMEQHALKYSKSYAQHRGSFWDKDFDMMACKTMLRQLISKWGKMSADMITGYTLDQSVINGDGTYEYIDNPNGGIINAIN